MTCEQWDVVVVPFPFTDRVAAKRRPAVVLSKRGFNQKGHSVLAMVTSSSHDPWPGDTSVADLASAGLHTSCIVRLKVFTLDDRLILRTIGRLGAADQKRVGVTLRTYLV